MEKVWKNLRKVVQKGGKSEEKTDKKSDRKNIEKKTTKAWSGKLTAGAGGPTNQQDNIQTNNKKTKVFS